MKIPSDQIEVKKKVGKLKNHSVWAVKTRGGLHVVALDSGQVLGSGPHRVVARHIAKRIEPDIEWTELSKSDHLDLEVFEHLLPKYEELTARMRGIQGKK